MRDWLTVIIVILIVVILVDGVRRMRIARRDKIRMSRSIYKSQSTREEPAKADLYTSELPNGGARVIGQRDPAMAPKAAKVSAKPSSRDQSSRDKHRPEQTSLNLDEAVPMLMESVDDVLLNNDAKERPASRNPLRPPASPRIPTPLPTAGSERGGERIEPTFSVEDPLVAAADDYEDDLDHPDYPQKQAPAAIHNDDEADYDEADYQDDETASEYMQEQEEDDYEDDFEDEDDPDDEQDLDSDYDELEDEYEPAQVAPAQPVTERQAAEPEEVLIINVMAVRGENFRGDELLDVLLKCGMRFGDMDIFHRYSDSKGDGALLFSLANMVKPGTFDLDAMDEFDTPGVSLFMTLPLKADSMQSFELMAETARTIAETLGGELKDEQRSVMTRQTIEHCRERIRDFERRRLFSRQR